MLTTNNINNRVNMYKPIKRDYGHHMVKAGEELGRFNMGSSIVSLVEVPKNFEFTIREGDKVKYGQLIGELK